ncbi:cell division protein FtsQ/DivIB [Patiriisocius sp. Uisw_017]|jgi:cell division protein FtsQ|uniref:cell division protein FtsQ/DivIB n=1 Tax=Patiriisocius sp. Uisw_017 TaxID=3230968 RepID=UPI0039E92A62
MKINWGLIKFLVLTTSIVVLFGFTKKRNESRKLNKIEVEFTDENDPFVTLNSVNKLLIQNHGSVTGITKEKVDLKEIELRLLKNDLIRTAQVFVTVDGTLGARIEQRDPIARVVAESDFYLDADGKEMPLSSVYSARVPIVTGAIKNNTELLTRLLLKLRADPFMNHSVVGLHCSKDGIVTMKMRKQSFKVLFGKAKDVALKFQNYKAFYQKAKMDSTLTTYETVNLQFGDQVVATKKQEYGTR